MSLTSFEFLTVFCIVQQCDLMGALRGVRVIEELFYRDCLLGGSAENYPCRCCI